MGRLIAKKSAGLEREIHPAERLENPTVTVGITDGELRASGGVVRIIGGDCETDREAWMKLANLGCSLLATLSKFKSLSWSGDGGDHSISMFDRKGTCRLLTSILPLIKASVDTLKNETTDTLAIELDPDEADVLEDIWYKDFAYFLNATDVLEYLNLPPDRVDYATMLRIGNAFIRNLITLSQAGSQRPLLVFEVRWKRFGRPFSGFVVDHGSVRGRTFREELCWFLGDLRDGLSS